MKGIQQNKLGAETRGVQTTRPLRIAFLTPTFATEFDSGGMGAYLHRIARALRELGHEPEVFTLSQEKASLLDFENIRVERLNLAQDIPLRLLTRLGAKVNISDLVEHLRGAWSLACAFSRRNREKPFDFLQSSDYGLAGLFIKKPSHCPHLVRCSWAADLFVRMDGNSEKLDSKLYCYLERLCIRRADLAYSPSEFVAKYYREKYGLELEVLRPPFVLETAEASSLPWELPQRYLMYFGAICPQKGADVLATALPLVWQQEPNFSMVWVGESWNGALESYRHIWGKNSPQVKWLGYLPSKPMVYGVLKRAEAVVIPSRTDNLPNTLIESLLLGVPVIGSLGASIDELVEPGRNGELVPIGDSVALAKALLRVWRRETSWMHGEVLPPSVVEQMRPDVAALNLIRLARSAPY